MEPINLVTSFLGRQQDPYAPTFDVQLTTHLQKYTDFRPHNVASYFFHAFLAFVFTIPETSLTKELGVQKIFFKEMPNRAGLKFIFLLKNQVAMKVKKTMVVRNVFLKPTVKDWERGITSYEYQGLKTSLASRMINLDEYDRNIDEYFVREAKLNKEEKEHISRRKVSVFIQKLYTDVRMISSEGEVAGPNTDFKTVMRISEALDNHRDLPIDLLINSIKQGDPKVYELRIRRLISRLRGIYLATEYRYNLKYDVWNGADCGFMFGTFLALESKLDLLPAVRHVMAFDEFDAPSKDFYGRFYLSLTPKKSLAQSNIELYLKHKPLAMSFIQDIPVDGAHEHLLQDFSLLKKYAFANNLHAEILLLKMDFQNRFGVTHHTEVPFNKHLDFLQKCDQHYDEMLRFKLDDGRQNMISYVNNVLDSIWQGSLGRNAYDKNYVSRYFLAMLLSMGDREQWEVFVQNNPEKMTFILESKVEENKRIVFTFLENPMEDRLSAREGSPLFLHDGEMLGDTVHVTIQQNFQHTKDDLIDPDSTTDLISREITIVGTNEKISKDNLISVDPFNIERTLTRNDMEIIKDDLQYLFNDFHLFINDKHQLAAFVDGLFHNTKHAKNILPLKPYQSHSQISCFHIENEGDDDLEPSHLNFLFSDDKDSETARKRDIMTSLKKVVKDLKGQIVNVLISDDPKNIQLDDMVQVSHSTISTASCFGRRKRSGKCDEEKELLPTDLESVHSFPVIDRTVRTIGEVSGYLMTGVMMRDFISDLIRQDTVAAVRDGTFFAGSIFSHKLASTAEIYGATLIKENRVLLGNSLRFAAPVLRRLTSAYVLSHLMSSIKEYNDNKNDTAAIVNIAVDSAFLTIDAAETSIEVMELFGVQAVEGLSAITGPIGMAIGAVLILGSNIYETVKKMQAINDEISLSPNQEVTETLRAFFHLDPSQEVQKEINEYDANELIAEQIKAQLKNQRKFKYYITSSGRIKNGKLQMMNDTIIDLQGKDTFVKSKANPKKVEIFCPLSESLNEHKKVIQKEKNFWKKLGSFFTDFYWNVKALIDAATSNFKSVALDVAKIDSEDLGSGYVCHNAFGIVNRNAESESAFYQLGSGYDRVRGFFDSPNVFNISNGQKVVYGGNTEDTFILSGKSIVGLLDGAGGVDTLDLSQFNPTSEFHMDDTRVTCGSSSFVAMNVNRIVGRRNIKNVIDSSCDLTAIDSRGGQDSRGSDMLIFKNITCSYNVTVILSSFTEVYTDNIDGIFRHTLTPSAHHISMSTSGVATHDITSNVPFTSISDWNFLNNTFTLSSNNIQILTLIGQVENFNINFKDGIQLKIKSGHIVTLLKTDHSIAKIIETYDGFLQSKNMSMIAYSTSDRQSIIFNHGKYSLQAENNQSIILNVIHNDLQNENHIVCSQGENVVLIRRAASSEFTIPDVYIYCEFGELVLDFSNMSSTICEHWQDCEVKVSGDMDHTSKLITLHVSILSDKNFTRFGTLFIDIESMSKIRIISYGTSRIIAKMPGEETQNKFSYNQFNDTNDVVNFYPINSSNAHLSSQKIRSLIIVPDSIYTDANTSFVYFTKCDLEYYQTVHFSEEIFNSGVYRINDTIMMTNLDEKLIWDQQNLLTIILEDYYVNEKLKTVRFIDAGRNVLNFNRPATIIGSLEDLWRRLVANDNFYYGY